MLFLWQLSQKNLGRNKMRSAISIIAIAVSVAIVIFARGFFLSVLNTQADLQIKYNSGHIRIVNQEYQVKEKLLSLGYPVDGLNQEGIQAMTSDLEKLAGVKMVIPRIKFGAMVSMADISESMLGIGVIPEKELAFTDLKKYITNGRFVESGKQEVTMGKVLLEKLKLSIGQKFTLLFTTAYGSLQGVTFTVVGEIDSGIKLLDEAVIYLPLDIAQMYLEMESQSTELLVINKDRNDTPRVLSAVQKYIADGGADGLYTAIPWEESSDLIKSSKANEKLYNIIYALIIMLACFIVINTLLMVVKERTKEIGMMSAMGLQPKEILGMFIVEGTLIGIFGSLIGVVIGGAITKYLSVVGIDFSNSVTQAGQDVLLLPMLYPTFSLANLLYAFILGVIITAIACTIPARKASQMEPTEALRAN